MTLEILLATMNQTDTCFIDSSIIGILDRFSNVSLLIINQCNKVKPILNVETQKIKIISVEETGLSKSRNLAVKNSKADICLIADDDCSYVEKSFSRIIQLHETFSESILTFELKDKDSSMKIKKYLPFAYRHNRFTIGRVSSWEISFKRKDITERGIVFNESYGLGAEYGRGEENIFLANCIDNKLKLKFVPCLIGSTSKFTTGTKLRAETGYVIGKVIRLMFNKKPGGLIYLFISNILKYNKFSISQFSLYFRNLLNGYFSIPS